MKISEELQRARDYEVREEQECAQVPRPAFHLTPRVGWMNDPNGFSYYQGQYHLFYQYHPYDSHWGPMHWGHAVSTDLLHWTHLPAALAPDTEADRDGCFSGSAVQLPDGRQLLIYTGIREETGPDGVKRVVQAQCIAVGDGQEYEKSGGNPVITAEDVPGRAWDVPLPEDPAPYQRLCRKEWSHADIDADAAMRERRILPEEFRDPKIQQAEDGSWRCIVAGGDAAHDGTVLSFCSEDALHWKFERTLLKNWGQFGRMWECPDLFELDGKTVLLVSPQDMLPQGQEYHSGNGTVCFLGKMTDGPMEMRESGDSTCFAMGPAFHAEWDQAVDYGLDFYASQTVLTPDGRRVLIGWLQSWETSMQHPKETPWFGQMSIPRELSLQYEEAGTDGSHLIRREDAGGGQDCLIQSEGPAAGRVRLIQRPIRELKALRCGEICYRDIVLEGERILTACSGQTTCAAFDAAVVAVSAADAVSPATLDGVQGRVIDLEIELDAVEGREPYEEFSVRFAEQGCFHAFVTYRPAQSLVTISREEAGTRRDFVHERSCLVRSQGAHLTMRIILDRFSVEVFLNGGEQVLSAAMYTDPAADGISFHSVGCVHMNLTKWDLVP